MWGCLEGPPALGSSWQTPPLARAPSKTDASQGPEAEAEPSSPSDVWGCLTRGARLVLVALGCLEFQREQLASSWSGGLCRQLYFGSGMALPRRQAQGDTSGVLRPAAASVRLMHCGLCHPRQMSKCSWWDAGPKALAACAAGIRLGSRLSQLMASCLQALLRALCSERLHESRPSSVAAKARVMEFAPAALSLEASCKHAKLSTGKVVTPEGANLKVLQLICAIWA